MKWFNNNRMRVVFIGFVVAIVFGGGTTKADFTIGDPVNLGPMINTPVEDGGPSISADGLSLYFYDFFKGYNLFYQGNDLSSALFCSLKGNSLPAFTFLLLTLTL